MTKSTTSSVKICSGGGYKCLYISPLAEAINFSGSQIICQSNPENAIPNMGWGGSYDQEPVD